MSQNSGKELPFQHPLVGAATDLLAVMPGRLGSGPLETQSKPVGAAYRALVGRIADLESDSGWPVDVDLLKVAGPLTRDEQAAVCDFHAQAMTDELSLDPAILASYLRNDIGAIDLVAHVREATERAAWEVIRADLLEECRSRAELSRSVRGESLPSSRAQLMSDLWLQESDFR